MLLTMKTYFARHTADLDVDDNTRSRLWNERIVAIHYPEDRNGIIGLTDNVSVDPDDYSTNAAINVRALRELASDGGYVLAEYHGHTDLLAGRVDADTQIDLLSAAWGENTGRNGRPAVLKGIHLKDAQIVTRHQLGDVWAARPARATLRRWPRAGNAIAYIVDGVTTSGESVNHWQRAYLAWNELADFACTTHTVSYETLAKLIGIHHRPLKLALALIQDYCLENKIPPLSILVVNKQTGRPGAGFIAWNADNIKEGFEQVRGFDWSRYGNPFAFAADGATKDDVVQRLVADPASSADVYAVTRVRGAVQMLFRDAVLRAYKSTCAFCGSTLIRGLEAAHILPWSDASWEARLDVRNGLVLTSWHHRLFDAGLLTITSDYRIHVVPPTQRLAPFDERALAEIDGRTIYLPADPRISPDPQLIRRRNELLGLDLEPE
jgi:putative restriction endonuclease